MRILSIAIALGSLATLRICSDEDDAPPPVGSAQAEVEVVAPEPAHGGTVVMAGEYPVEVLAHESGEVYAYVHGDAPPPGRASIEVDVGTRGGGRRTVELDWHRGRHRWEGRVANVVLVPGEVDVHFHVDGVVWHGHVAHFVFAPAIIVEVEDHVREIHIHHKHHKHRKHHDHHGGFEVRIH